MEVGFLEPEIRSKRIPDHLPSLIGSNLGV